MSAIRWVSSPTIKPAPLFLASRISRSLGTFAVVRILAAEGDALFQQIKDQIVDAQRRCDVVCREREFCGGGGGQAGDVGGPMLAGAQEEGAYDDVAGAALGAAA